MSTEYDKWLDEEVEKHPNFKAWWEKNKERAVKAFLEGDYETTRKLIEECGEIGRADARTEMEQKRSKLV